MVGLLARDADLAPGSHPGGRPRYDRVVYLVSPAARPVTERNPSTAQPGNRARFSCTPLERTAQNPTPLLSLARSVESRQRSARRPAMGVRRTLPDCPDCPAVVICASQAE